MEEWMVKKVSEEANRGSKEERLRNEVLNSLALSPVFPHSSFPSSLSLHVSISHSVLESLDT